MKHGNYSVTRGSLNLRDVLRGGNFALMIVMHGGRRTGGRAAETTALTGALPQRNACSLYRRGAAGESISLSALIVL